MEIINTFINYSSFKKTIITIGTFDGVHVGHQKILKQLVEHAKKNKKKSLLFTFFPHPRMVLQKNSNIKLINTIKERAILLERIGIDTLIIQPFDESFSKLTAFEFVRNVLVEKLDVSKIFIGYDHRFGKNREGNFEQLQEYAAMFKFDVEEISVKSLNDITISSTKIRKALSNGNIEKATKYLGYNFMLTGTVVTGNNIGTNIGFPTANIFIKEDYKLIPKNGVYIVKSILNGKLFYGMMNIGTRPTINGKQQTIEVHFFNFDGNLYNKNICVELLKFMRKEQKFDSLNQLKSQLKIDKTNSLNFIKNISSIS